MKYLLIAVVALMLVVVGFLPKMVSTPTGTQWLLGWINGKISGQLAVDSLQLRWFGTQKIEGLKLNDAQGKEIVSIASLQTDTALLPLLVSHKRFGATDIRTPYLYLVTEESGELNLEQTLSSPKQRKPRLFKKREKALQLPCFSGPLTLNGGTILFASPKVKPVTISNFEISYHPSSDHFHIQATTDQGGVNGDLLAEGSLSKTFHLSAQINRFPVAILDQLQGKTFYTTAIGEVLDAQIAAQGFHVTAKLSSTNLNGLIQGVVEGATLILSPGSQLTYTLTPTTFHALLPQEAQKTWGLASKSDVTVMLQEGKIPFKHMDALTLNAVAHLERAELNHAEAGPYSFNGVEATLAASEQQMKLAAKGTIQGREETHAELTLLFHTSSRATFELNTEGFPLALLEASVEEGELLHTFFGEVRRVHAEGGVDDGEIQSHFVIDSTTAKVEGDIEGKRLADLDFRLSGEHTLPDNVTPYLGDTLTFAFNGKAGIVEENFFLSTVKGKLQSPYFDVDVQGSLGSAKHPFSQEQLQLNAKGILLQLPYGEHFPATSLKKGSFELTLDGAKNSLVGSGKVQVTTLVDGESIDSKPSTIYVEINELFTEKGIEWQKARVQFSCDLHQFPLAIFNAFLPEGVDLSFFIAETADVKVQGFYAPQEQPIAHMTLKASAPGFETEFTLTMNGEWKLVQTRPAHLHWELTPARYAYLMQRTFLNYESEFYLAAPAKIDLEMTELTCPPLFSGTWQTLFCQGGIVGRLQISPATFINHRTHESLTLQHTTCALKGENFSKEIALQLSGELLSSTLSLPEPSLFQFDGLLTHLWTEEGKLNHEQLGVSGELNLELLPVNPIVGIIPMQLETRLNLMALLGELLNARISGQVVQREGPVTIDLKASNLKVLLPIQLTPQAILLRDYVEAEITLTPQVSERFLVDINPMLLTGASSEHPLKLYIDPEGFSVAINPFSLKGIHMEKGILDIGKIAVRNGGEIQALMTFLKAQEISEDNWMEAWFTPIFITLKEGTASYKRFDLLLANMVHIAFWGRIDLVKDKVKMTMGIAPTTLQQRFHLMGLTKSEMFQVKMRGKTSNVEMDWSSAYTRIGILATRLAGGQIGYLVGGVLEQLINVFGEEPAPPPTTVPFPWEAQYPSEPGEFIPQEASPPSLKKKGVKKLFEFLIP